MFDTVNRWKSDGRTPEHGYIISYSAQANLKGSFIHVYSSLSKMCFDVECIRSMLLM